MQSENYANVLSRIAGWAALMTSLLSAPGVAADRTWWSLNGADSHRIFIAARDTSVIVKVCARNLKGANAIEVLARQADGQMIDDLMVLGGDCHEMSRQFQHDQTAWIRLRRGPKAESPAIKGDRGEVTFNIMPVNG